MLKGDDFLGGRRRGTNSAALQLSNEERSPFHTRKPNSRMNSRQIPVCCTREFVFKLAEIRRSTPSSMPRIRSDQR